jgi:hypothetical protein
VPQCNRPAITRAHVGSIAPQTSRRRGYQTLSIKSYLSRAPQPRHAAAPRHSAVPPAQAMPTLKVAKTLWGVDEAADTGKWDALFARIASEGFDGVEVIAPTWRADPALLTSLLTKHGLALICQLHTTGGDIVGGEYVYCSSCKLDDHVASFEALATT